MSFPIFNITYRLFLTTAQHWAIYQANVMMTLTTLIPIYVQLTQAVSSL